MHVRVCVCFFEFVYVYIFNGVYTCINLCIYKI